LDGICQDDAVGSRTMRVTLIVVAVLLVLGFVVDRLTAHVAADQIATEAQRSQHLPTKPSVSLGGPLFLPQVVAGDYHDVNVDIRGSVQDGLRIDRVRSHLDGVHIPLSSIIGGRVTTVPVDSLDADVELTFADLNAYLAAQNQSGALVSNISVHAAGSAIRISASVNIGGQHYPSEGTADLGVQPGAVTFTPRELSQGIAAILPPGLREQVVKLLTVTVPIVGLPFNLKLTSATVLADRLRFSAAGTNVVLDTTAVTPGTSQPSTR
jgi:hypothetical protein